MSKLPLNNKPVILVLVLWIALGVTIGVSCGRDNRDNRPIGLNEPAGGGIGVDYPKSYDNLTELASDAALIAVGRIDRTVRVGPDGQPPRGTYTKSAFRLERVLKGDKNGEVIVNQIGAIGQAEDVADPIFRPGEEAVLFLKTNGEVYFLPGPWGRYRIVDNKVYSMNYVVNNTGYYDAPLDLNFHGVELDMFLKDIAETVPAPRTAR